MSHQRPPDLTEAARAGVQAMVDASQSGRLRLRSSPLVRAEFSRFRERIGRALPVEDTVS